MKSINRERERPRLDETDDTEQESAGDVEDWPRRFK